MKVILLKDVGGVGQRDSVCDVADGYALNYLIPRGLAMQATEKGIEALEAKLKEKTALHTEREAAWKELSRKLEGARLTVAARANDRGHLYHQLPLEEIADAVKKKYHVVVPAEAFILIAPIKSIGESIVQFRIGSHTARLTVNVVQTV